MKNNCGVGRQPSIDQTPAVDPAGPVSDRRFQALIENAADIITVADATGRILYASPASERVVGQPAAEFLGENVFTLLHPADADAACRLFQEVVDQPGTMRRTEARVRASDGSWRVLEIVGRNLLDDPAVRGIVLNSRDITARKQAEEAIRESENRFRTLAESIPQLVWISAADGRPEYINGRRQVYTGMSLEQARAEGGWSRVVHPDDAQRVETLRAISLATGQDFQCEYRLRRATDGQYRWFLGRAVPLKDGDGRVLKWIGSATDIDDQKRAEAALQQAHDGLERRVKERTAALQESEEKYRVLFETSRDAIMTTDRTGFLDCNQATLNIFGCTSRDEFIAKYPSEFSPPRQPDGRDSLTAARERIEAAYAAGSQFFEWMHRRMDGTVFPATVLLSRFELSGQTVLQAVVRDITDQRRLEQQILQISERERRRIAQELHDGLGQRLTGLAFLSKALQNRLAAGKQKEARSVQQIVGLLNDAISDTRNLSHGLHPVEPKPTGLMDALSELADTTSNLFHLHCRFVCPNRVLVRDNIAATHLFRIVQEAVNNAVKHARAKLVWVSLRRQEDQLILQIRDDGRGLPRKPPAHRGLGLQIMSYRASLIGGSLQAQRGDRRGTVVTCTLPAAGPGLPRSRRPRHESTVPRPE